MKVGEALSLRAIQAQKLADLRQRIQRNALVQEGDQPSENPNELLDAFEQLSDEHRDLVTKINLANVREQARLLDPLQKREHLRRTKNNLEAATGAAIPSNTRWMRTEIKMVAQIDVKKEQVRIDAITEEIRQLDAQIQEANWQIDL